MARRRRVAMAWTLYRYILRDLAKVLALTAGVLVIVMSFGAAIKPITDGMLGATALLRFVLYSAPTFLGFVLPFAGAFAGTLVFSRLVGDNEVQACSAGGMSYGSILLPVTLLGLALTMGMFFLSNWVVPRFYEATAAVIEQDITRAIVGTIRKGEPIVLDDLDRSVLFADAAEERPAPAAPEGQLQPTRLIQLQNVVFGQRDAEGRVRSEYTAARADVFLYAQGVQSYAVIRLQQFAHFNAAAGGFESASAEVDAVTLPPVKLRSPFRDDPKFRSAPDLWRWARDPQRFDQVRQLKLQLARLLEAERTLASLAQALEQSNRDPAAPPVELAGPLRGERYRIHAPTVARADDTLQLLGTDDRPVRIERLARGEVKRIITTTAATLRIDSDTDERQPLIRTELASARITDPQAPTRGGEPLEHALPRTRWAPAATDLAALQEAPINDLLHLASVRPYRQVKPIRTTAEQLDHQRTRLQHRIRAELHERAATAVSCVLLLLLGAVLAMKLRTSLALVTFLWSFLLAVATIIIINAGKNVAEGGVVGLWAGLGMLWSGNVVLAIVTGAVYCALARN